MMSPSRDIERRRREEFLLGIRNELLSWMYLPMRNREKEIPKGQRKSPESWEYQLYETE